MKETVALFYVQKGKKYMKSHGYSTLKGYRFFWTSNKEEARKMELGTANGLSLSSKGKVIYA